MITFGNVLFFIIIVMVSIELLKPVSEKYSSYEYAPTYEECKLRYKPGYFDHNRDTYSTQAMKYSDKIFKSKLMIARYEKMIADGKSKGDALYGIKSALGDEKYNLTLWEGLRNDYHNNPSKTPNDNVRSEYCEDAFIEYRRSLSPPTVRVAAPPPPPSSSYQRQGGKSGYGGGGGIRRNK